MVSGPEELPVISSGVRQWSLLRQHEVAASLFELVAKQTFKI